MGRYRVIMLAGPYAQRQRTANAAGAVCYFEQHLNAVDAPEPRYAMARVSERHSKTSAAWGTQYAALAAAATGYEVRSAGGLDVGGRGDGNLRLTDMPAIIAEPCFISNPETARRLCATPFLDALALVAVASIVERFPAGPIAISPGHGDTDGRNPQHWDPGAVSPELPDLLGSQLTEAMVVRAIVARVKRALESL